MTSLFQFFAHVEPKPKEKLDVAIGPCCNKIPTKCHGEVDLVVCANTICIMLVPVWTLSTEELVYCPRCQSTMVPAEYEKQCVPLIEVIDDVHKVCPKCKGELEEGSKQYCPGCSSTFLSMV